MQILVLGKRNGILQWYEHLLGVKLPSSTLLGFPLNHANNWQRLNSHFSKVVLQKNLWEIVEARLCKFLQKQRPDLCVIVDAFYLHSGVDRLLGELGVPVCQWVGDRFDKKLFENRCVTHFFYTNTGLHEDAISSGDTRGHYLPLAVNPLLFAENGEWSSRSLEPLFIGAWSENRERLLASVSVPLAIYGKGWDRLQGTQHRILATNISLSRVAKLYTQHRYVLNVINSANIESGLNMRCFEAPASGACLITDDVADLPSCYTAGKEVIAYKSAKDLSETLNLLASGALNAEEIAAAGRARCLKEHTYAHRLSEMISVAFA